MLSTNISSDGNSLEFDLEIRLLYQMQGAAPVYYVYTDQKNVSKAMLPALLLGTLEYVENPSNISKINVVARDIPDTSFQGQPTRRIKLMERNGNIAEYGCDYSYHYSDYSYQLGLVLLNAVSAVCTYPDNYGRFLVCYQVGNLFELPCPYLGPPVANDPLTEAGEMRIFPNPNAGSFQIEWDNLASKGMSARLHDLNGRLVWDREIRSSKSGSLQVQIEVAPGIYILSLQETAGGEVLRKKMVIQ